MADPGYGPHGAPPAARYVEPRRGLQASFWIRELPFSLVLLLTLGGVAYTTFSKQRILIYWEVLAPIIGLVCVWYGWPRAPTKLR
ncbi:MAG: hypothetical protein ACREDL_10515, partial [Bradyrhizobium sp.]